MLSQQFIFSEKKNDRIRRHLLFWVVWGVYYTSLHVASPFLRPEVSNFNNIPFTGTEAFIFLAPHILITYVTLYFILPIYIREEKLLKAIVCLLASWGAYYFLYQYTLQNFVPIILNRILPEKYLVHTQRPANVTHFIGLLSVFVGGVSCAALVTGVNYIKQWYLKEQRNLQLQKENTESQLQLLTAQVHPHFLFNTLNNIYSQTQSESPKGSKMIMELSDMLRYILAEGSKGLVPLQKELTMIRDYINLEKVRYGNKLDLHLSIPDDAGNLQIAPLLLLPFVENCFKHGASRFLSDPWINLKIEINGKLLLMKLMNGKELTEQEGKLKLGTGIANVKKRLYLLYQDKYDLQITDEPEVFVVNLSLELTEGKKESTIIKEPTTTLDYA